jgi:ATP-dependent DNA helicase RecQ
VADHLAAIGRLDRGGLAMTGPAPPDLRELGSAEEALLWRERLSVPDPDLVRGRAVLLVVDATSTLWPVTVAASTLQRAGASVVLPLLLHRRP